MTLPRLTIALLLAGPAYLSAQDIKVKEEKPGLLKKATITPQAAMASALSQVPNGKVTSSEIEEENGRLIYTFDIKATGKSGVEEVNVDAMTGTVLPVEHEDAATEAKEAKAEKAAKAKAKSPVKKP